MPEDDYAAFEDRYVLYFDFLGSSEAATTWPRERLYEFVDLLRSIAQVQSSEAIDGESQEDGSFRISITPEITTFSDHVVVSWRGAQGEDLPEILVSYWTEIVCKDAIRILWAVAYHVEKSPTGADPNFGVSADGASSAGPRTAGNSATSMAAGRAVSCSRVGSRPP